jgi:hypothetical protein
MIAAPPPLLPRQRYTEPLQLAHTNVELAIKFDQLPAMLNAAAVPPSIDNTDSGVVMSDWEAAVVAAATAPTPPQQDNRCSTAVVPAGTMAQTKSSAATSEFGKIVIGSEAGLPENKDARAAVKLDAVPEAMTSVEPSETQTQAPEVFAPHKKSGPGTTNEGVKYTMGRLMVMLWLEAFVKTVKNAADALPDSTKL